MKQHTFEALDTEDLDTIVGGRSQRGACFGQVAMGAGVGAMSGFGWTGGNPVAATAGAIGGGVGAFLMTPSCNDGRQSYAEEAGSYMFDE